MTNNFEERLNQILPKITSDKFLSGRGIGKETPFYIFDYQPEEELRIRKHIASLLDYIPKQNPNLRIAHVNLFDLIIKHLRQRGLLDKTLEFQRSKGDQYVLRQLEKILHPSKLSPFFTELVQPEEKDLVLISGVGNIWPLMRTHTLLNNLHSVMGNTPLVMFYPGNYDGQSLRLFGKIKSDNYYRAFRLIP